MYIYIYIYTFLFHPEQVRNNVYFDYYRFITCLTVSSATVVKKEEEKMH